MKNKFSVFDFLFEQDMGEEDEEEEQGQIPPDDPAMGGEIPQDMPTDPGMPAPPQPSAPAPQQPQAQMPKPAPVSSDNFSRLIGKTISNITFEGIGENGGKIKIQTSDSHVPIEIGWVNNQITVSDPSKLKAPVKPMKKR